ncbi:MAG: DUF1269 domain-containing protein [Coriobacteriia bacterium]
MSTLIVIGYPDETTADKVWTDLKKAESDYIVDLDNAAVIIHHENGKFDVHTGYHIVGTQTTWGFFWGALFGLLFFVPLFGMAIGAGMGVIMGAIEKSSIDKQFTDKVREQVKPGTSALFMVLHSATMDKFMAAIEPFGGTVLQTSLSDEDEKKFQSALHEPAAS